MEITPDVCSGSSFYKDDDDSVPVLDWLDLMEQRDRRVRIKCERAIEELAGRGYELRRPMADYLRDKIYELRIRHGSVNYRILYFFHGQTVAVLAHGLTKEAEVPAKDIDIAVERSKKYIAKPEEHQAIVEEDEEDDQDEEDEQVGEDDEQQDE